MAYSIPHLRISIGTHYEIGFNIGKEFENRIKRYFESFTDFHDVILPYLDTPEGNKVFENFFSIIQCKLPWYIDEMKGISDGSNIPFKHILAINFRVELLHLCKHKDECIIIKEDSSEQLLECSTFFLNNRENHVLVHNEDASKAIFDTGYLISCKIKGKDYNGLKSPDEEFTCFCYPGHLPGNAFAFNSNGFVFSVNALLPKYISLERYRLTLARQIVTRYMLAAKSLEDLEAIILNTPIAYGISLNVGYFGGDSAKLKTTWNTEYFNIQNKEIFSSNCEIMFNYEIAPNLESSSVSLISKHCVISSDKVVDSSFVSEYYYYHFNHYERVNILECIVNSSHHRKQTADGMKKPETLNDLLEMAFDVSDIQYPIYRSPLKDYSVCCICTAVFDLKNKTLSILNGDVSKKPFLTVLMD